MASFSNRFGKSRTAPRPVRALVSSNLDMSLLYERIMMSQGLLLDEQTFDFKARIFRISNKIGNLLKIGMPDYIVTN